MVNRRGMIEYYYNNRKDINTLTEKDVLGKSLFEIYSSIDMENSTLMEVMRTGQDVYKRQVLQQDVNTENLKDIVAPEVAAEFMDEKLNQAAELISRQEFTADMQKQEDGSLCKRWREKE